MDRNILPPDHLKLREKDYPFWTAIIATKEDWTEADLTVAYFLTRNTADIISLQKRVSKEGRILAGKPNPIVKMLETLELRMLAMQRHIGINSRAIFGPARDQVKRNQAWRRAQEALKDADDGLIGGTKKIQ